MKTYTITFIDGYTRIIKADEFKVNDYILEFYKRPDNQYLSISTDNLIYFCNFKQVKYVNIRNGK